jgi:DNA (cytosine-5)-methyltransferase 1
MKIQLHNDLELLAAARKVFSQRQLAAELGVHTRTVRRWELRQSSPPPYIAKALKDLLPPPPLETGSFTFVDLFAGIGGVRLPFQEIGGSCVMTCEWDPYAQQTYRANFPGEHPVVGDISQLHEDDVPDHDLLLAGFPCQPFSIAGVSKKNALGRAHGFEDVTQGTLFFDVARILAHKRPQAFVLENVKNLLSHDQGRTFKIILSTLRDELGYSVKYRVIDGAHFVPQHRERMVIVGFREDVGFDFNILSLPEKGQRKLATVLHHTDGTEPLVEGDGDRYFEHKRKRVAPKYTLTDNLWRYLQEYAAKHRAKGNGFGFGLVDREAITRTLSARYYKDGSEILIRQGANTNPRRLTPRECARLMGFPDTFAIPVSDTRAYKQFGNSVVVPLMREIAKAVRPFIGNATSQVRLPF